jgi:hypothetical protein
MSSPRYRSPDRRHLTLDHVLGVGAVDFRPVAVAIARDATLSPSCLGKSANLTKAIGTLSGTEIEVNMTSPTIVGVGARVGSSSGAKGRAIASGGSPGAAEERRRSCLPSAGEPSANQSLAVLFPETKLRRLWQRSVERLRAYSFGGVPYLSASKPIGSSLTMSRSA